MLPHRVHSQVAEKILADVLRKVLGRFMWTQNMLNQVFVDKELELSSSYGQYV